MQEGLAAVQKRSVPRAGLSRLHFNRRVGPGWYHMRLEEPAIARASAPGQFVEIATGALGGFDPLLRRPMSVYDADPKTGTYDILYTVTGRGTHWLSQLPESPTAGALSALDVLGPFGNRFTQPTPIHGQLPHVYLVGGGVGVAPLYFFARELGEQSSPASITLCMGARSAAQLQGIDEFRKLPIECCVATNDGSAGHAGFVTALLSALLDQRTGARPVQIYGCGPTGMNEALRSLAVLRGLPCEISLEARMACGFGICFACVVPIRKELGGPFYNRRICWEGTVFDARLLKGAAEA